jgi:alpha-ketoglutarate-dependent 2,4-dichlorophenoxyacetate dioxygenase
VVEPQAGRRRHSRRGIDERPKARHPLVHVHKGSGRKALFIAAHTMDVEGMPRTKAVR